MADLIETLPRAIQPEPPKSAPTTIIENLADLWGSVSNTPFIATALIAALLIGIAVPLYQTYRDRAKNQSEPEPATLSGLRVLAVVLALVGVPTFAFILFAILSIIASFDPVKLDADLRWHVLAFVGLITSLGALISAPLALIRVWTTERQTRISEQGHMTDRISKAVEQLGAEKTVKVFVEGDGETGDKTVERTLPNIEVRIGGLLSLERIAQDSVAFDKGRDHVRVMEIICAYIRNNSKVGDAITPPPQTKLIQALKNHSKNGENFLLSYTKACQEVSSDQASNETAKTEWLDEIRSQVRSDIQMALKIIGNRTPQQKDIERRPCHELYVERAEAANKLRETVLIGGDRIRIHETLDRLSRQKLGGYRLDLSEVNFQGYTLAELDLSYAKLSHSTFEAANLNGTNFFGADLSLSRFNDSRLADSNLQFADIAYCSFLECYGPRAKFLSNNLQGCTFWGGVFSESEFLDVHMGGRLLKLNLSNAILDIQSCVNMDLVDCRLSKALLRGVKLDQFSTFFVKDAGSIIVSKRIFEETALKDFHVAEGTVIDADFSRSFGDGSVQLPNRIQRPEHWPDADLDWSDFEREWRKWQANPKTYRYTPPTA
jgi:uncharacterized protein YjbI with pentapeptide repeats